MPSINSRIIRAVLFQSLSATVADEVESALRSALDVIIVRLDKIDESIEKLSTKDEIKKLENEIIATRASLHDRIDREFNRYNRRLSNVHTDIRGIKESVGLESSDDDDT